MIDEDESPPPEETSNVVAFKPVSFRSHCDTPSTKRMFDWFDAIRAVPSTIGVILGVSGIGKSVASRAYADDYSLSVCRVELTLSTCTRRELLDAILDALGLFHDPQRSYSRGAAAERKNFDLLVKEFTEKRNPLLILDEAQKLEGNVGALELIRELRDAAPVSIALVGNPYFTAVLPSLPQDAGKLEFRQIASRIAICRTIEPSPADIDAVCEFHGLNSADARKLVRKWATKDGRLHKVRELIAYAQAIAGPDQALTIRHLEMASRQLS